MRTIALHFLSKNQRNPLYPSPSVWCLDGVSTRQTGVQAIPLIDSHSYIVQGCLDLIGFRWLWSDCSISTLPNCDLWEHFITGGFEVFCCPKVFLPKRFSALFGKPLEKWQENSWQGFYCHFPKGFQKRAEKPLGRKTPQKPLWWNAPLG